jgi:hypothetical protein
VRTCSERSTHRDRIGQQPLIAVKNDPPDDNRRHRIQILRLLLLQADASRELLLTPRSTTYCDSVNNFVRPWPTTLGDVWFCYCSACESNKGYPVIIINMALSKGKIKIILVNRLNTKYLDLAVTSQTILAYHNRHIVTRTQELYSAIK